MPLPLKVTYQKMFIIELSVAVHHRTRYGTAVVLRLTCPLINTPFSTVNGAWFEICVIKQNTCPASEL